jgi:O-antigen/teichoic acid export membrane protein
LADSLARRYSFKLAGNIVSSASHLVAQALVPRALGPAVYGDFQFVTGTLNRFVGFVILGTPFALNNKIAQRPKDDGLTTFFAYIAAGIAAVTAVFLLVSQLTGASSWMWPGQSIVFVWAAAIWVYGQWAYQVVGGAADAYGHTVTIERSRMWQSIASTIVLLVLFVGGWLTLTTMYLYYYAVFAALALAWIAILRSAGHPVLVRWRLTRDERRGYFREFYEYSHPLVVYSAVAFVTGAGERWILQWFGGSVEQGFFGLAFQISAASFLFTGAMTPVIGREFSVAARAKDTASMARLFRRHIPLLYAVAAAFCAFVASQADRVVTTLGGGMFAGAALPMAIMAFYPAHQTYGQLCSTVFYAMGETRLYRNIGIVAMTAGMALAWWLMVPPSMFGLGAGAVGLAVKTIATQVLAVNLQLYYSCRLLGLRFSRYLAHQVLAMAVPVTLALAARLAADFVVPAGRVPLAPLVAAGVLYLALVVALAAAVPRVYGLSKDDVMDAVRLVRGAIGARP